MSKESPTYEDLQKRISHLEFRLRQIESRDYIVKANDAELESLRVDYEIVFRNTNFYVACYKPDGEILGYNKIAADEVGYTPDEIIGKKVWDIFDKAQADLFFSRMQKAMNERKILKYEELNETKLGSSCYETDYIPIYDDDKELLGCQVIARDIGEKKNAIYKMETSNELFRSVFERSNEGITVLNNNLEIIEVNRKFADMLGYTVNEILQMKIEDFSFDDNVEEEEKYLQKIIAGELNEYNIEKRFLKKNGEFFWGALSSNAVRDKKGKILYVVRFVVEIKK